MRTLSTFDSAGRSRDAGVGLPLRLGWLLAAALLAAGLAADAAGQDQGGLALRLDRVLDTAPRTSAGRADPVLTRFGSSDLRRRLAAAREERDALGRKRQAIEARLAEREQLMAELQSLSEVQDGTIGALRSGIDAARTLGEQRGATSGQGRGEGSGARAKQRQSPAAAPSASGPETVLFGVLPLDARVAVDAGLGLALVGVLAWALYLRRRTRAADVSLAAAEQDTLDLDLDLLGGGGVESGTNAAGSVPSSGRTSGGQSDSVTVVELADYASKAAARGRESGRERGAPASAPGQAASAPEPAPAATPEPAAASAARAEPASTQPAGDAAQADQSAQINADGTWTETRVKRVAADPNALREVDTLIAFEDFENAALLLEKLVANNPNNPEYALRLMHVEAQRGNEDRSAAEEELLNELMDGPLSETLGRVKEFGRGLIPGHPLFQDDNTRSEAGGSGDGHRTLDLQGSHTDTIEIPVEEQHQSTMILSAVPGPEEEAPREKSEDELGLEELSRTVEMPKLQLEPK